MGSKRLGQVRFRAISGDHSGAQHPHLHADIGSGEVVIELMEGGDVRLSEAHGDPIRGKVKDSEVRIVLRTALENFDTLMTLWEGSQSHA